VADVTWHTQSDSGTLADASSIKSLSASTASVSEVCSWSQLLAADDDDDDDDDEHDAEPHGDAALVTSSVAFGVLRHCDEHGVIEQLGEPISNFGVCQQQDDVQSGVPCNEHITESSCNERTLTTDCDVLRGNTASRSSFLNAYSGCFTPTNTSRLVSCPHYS